MRFTKMQGLGNDYLYVFGEVPANIESLCKKLSDRHFGAGADGMIYITPSENADFGMRIFNADGSEAKMCGNGIRCVGKYLYDKGYTDKTELKIETLSGPRALTLDIENGKAVGACVDMGKAAVEGETPLTVRGKELKLTLVNVGNPHAVCFPEDEDILPETYGESIEKNKAFPGGVNVEFVRVTGKNRLRMRVWERGSGITMACGTGACASCAAAVSKGLCAASEPIAVQLDGGELEITVSEDGRVLMRGPAETVYEGECAEC